MENDHLIPLFTKDNTIIGYYPQIRFHCHPDVINEEINKRILLAKHQRLSHKNHISLSRHTEDEEQKEHENYAVVI